MGKGRAFLAVLAAAIILPGSARADDFGARGAVARVRSDAQRLLAHRVRASGADPKLLSISDVVVSGDQALLSWNSGKARGVMGLVVSSDRWWDALDMTTPAGPDTCWSTVKAYPLAATIPYPPAYTSPGDGSAPDPETLRDDGLNEDVIAPATLHNADVRNQDPRGCKASVHTVNPDLAVQPNGAVIRPPRSQTSGYGITISYAHNDAAPDAKIEQIFARAPSPAEFAPNHAPAPDWGGPDAVCFFDVALAARKPVTFAKGTTIDVWFPFVLDDQLRYNLSFFSSDKPSGMIFGTVFDNTLHFVLPEFTVTPGKPLMAEIDGDVKGPS